MKGRAGNWVPALIVFFVGIAVWQWVLSPLAGKFLLPRPSAIAKAFWDNRQVLVNAGWFTFKEALGGFVIGSGAAILVALVFARFQRVGSALMPYAIAASAVPIIASTVATLSPAKMNGRAAGIRTRRKMSTSPAA